MKNAQRLVMVYDYLDAGRSRITVTSPVTKVGPEEALAEFQTALDTAVADTATHFEFGGEQYPVAHFLNYGSYTWPLFHTLDEWYGSSNWK